MLSQFEQMQNGMLNSRSFMISETTRRLYKLELSKYKNLEDLHDSGVKDLDIDPVENRYLLSGSTSGAIGIHDLSNRWGKPSYTCSTVAEIRRYGSVRPYGHFFSVDTVEWYPFDTGLFTTSSMDRQLIVWDTNRIMAIETFQMPGKVYAHTISPIGTHHTLAAAATCYPHIILVDIKSGAICHELRGHKSKVVSVKWSPSSEHVLASGGEDNKIFLWDIRSAKGYISTFDQHNGEAKGSRHDHISAHSGIVNYLRFTSDGLYLLSYGTDSRLRLWDVYKNSNTLVNYGRISNDNPKGMQFDISYDNTLPLIFVPSETNIFVLDMFSGATVSRLIGHFNAANCCVLRHDFQELYSGGNDRHILIWTHDIEQEDDYTSGINETKKSFSGNIRTMLKKNFVSDAWSSEED